jgi:predicted peptidase
MKHFILAILVFAAAAAQQVTAAPLKDSVMLKTASGHPMQYFISLPEGWSKQKKWPVIVVIEAADKEYRENALRFVRARKNLPFIIVAPYNVNNSRSGRRDPAIFPYSPQTWDYIEKVSDCQFNLDGLTQVVKDVQSEYNGEDKYYLTGFEAGTHTVWQMVFQHPERLRAAAPVEGNYNQNSCMSAPLFSTDISRVNLPVKGFAGADDNVFGPKGPIYSQWQAAKKAASDHGFTKVDEIVIDGKGHVPMPDEVVAYFYGLFRQDQKR